MKNDFIRLFLISSPRVQRLGPDKAPGEDDLLTVFGARPDSELVKVNQCDASAGLSVELVVTREDACVLGLLVEELQLSYSGFRGAEGVYLMRAVNAVHVVLVLIPFLIPGPGRVEDREAVARCQEFMGPDLHLTLFLCVEALGPMLEMTVDLLDHDGPVLGI